VCGAWGASRLGHRSMPTCVSSPEPSHLSTGDPRKASHVSAGQRISTVPNGGLLERTVAAGTGVFTEKIRCRTLDPTAIDRLHASAADACSKALLSLGGDGTPATGSTPSPSARAYRRFPNSCIAPRRCCLRSTR
jgi:hypothetical protein